MTGSRRVLQDPAASAKLTALERSKVDSHCSLDSYLVIWI